MVGLRQPRCGSQEHAVGVVLLSGRPVADDASEFFPCGPARKVTAEIEVALPELQDRRGALDGLQGADAAGRRRASRSAFATVSQDVTERRRLEDNLRELAADLSEADRRKNEFLAMLAHELRNPLAPISNAARALRLGGSDGESRCARRRTCSSARSRRCRAWWTTCWT